MDKKDYGAYNSDSLMKIKSPTHLLTLKNNNSFCNKFFEQSQISSVTDATDYFDDPSNLVYDLSRASSFEAEAFQAIIDLLMQLRAAGNDQNVFIQNNTVVREQILSQLKNQILKVSHKLTSNQIKNLEVISSNSFDEKTLTDILKSLLESSKKKLIGSESADSDFRVKGTSHYITLDKISKSYLTVLDKSLYYEKVIDKILKNISHDKIKSENELVISKPDKKISQPESEINLKRRSLKELLTKKAHINISEVLEEISKSYEEKVINKMGLTTHVTKLQSKISEINLLTIDKILKNISHDEIKSENELVISKPDKKTSQPESEINLKRRSLKELLTKKAHINISEVLEEISKSYEEKVINKMGLTTHVTKLQSKISEINLLTIDKILKNISHDKIKSENELVISKPDKKTSQPESEVNLKRRSLKELLTKKAHINISEVLEEISKSYEEKVINKMGLTTHVTKLQSKISEINLLTIDKILKNISHDKIKSENELVISKPDKKTSQPESEVNLKRRSLKELLAKKAHINISEVLEEISKSYEEKVINKMGLIAHVTKLQSKISEINLLTKVGSFVEDIVKNSVPKILMSETQLINKIVDKSKIDELRENIISNQQQYEEDRAYQQRDISRVYNEVRKLYNAKNFSRSITEVLRSTNIKALNIEENVKKNLLKLTSKKDIINKFKNIYDHATERALISRVTEKTELINRQSVQHTDTEETTAVRDVVNLKRSGTFVDKKFIEDIRENNILMRDARIRRRNYEQIHKNAEKLNVDLYEDENFRNTTLALSLINLSKFGINDIEDHFFKQKNIFSDEYGRNILENRYNKITENIENKFKKEIISVNEKEIHEKLKLIFDKQDPSVLNRSKTTSLATTQSADGTKVEVWDKEDIYKFVPVHIKEKILNENEIENIFSKNIVKILSPQIMKSRTLKLHEKNIYRDFTQNQIHRYIEKSYDLKKEYLINERGTLSKESQYGHINEDYMIYKELETHQKQTQALKKAKTVHETEQEPDIVIKEKQTPPPMFDTQAIEKNIMAKTLNKKDVVALIESYMDGINIEDISQTVIGKVERKLMMDKRRNGIF